MAPARRHGSVRCGAPSGFVRSSVETTCVDPEADPSEGGDAPESFVSPVPSPDPGWLIPVVADLRRALSKPGLSPETVDDLVQEASERLIRGLPRLRDRDRLGPYVGRIVRSVWVDHLRRRRATEPLPPDLVAAEPPPLDLSPVVASWLPALIEALPERYREPVRLVELEGHSQRQVAERLGLSASGARTRVQRGRRKLRALLEACCTLQRQGTRVVGIEPAPGCCPDQDSP